MEIKISIPNIDAALRRFDEMPAKVVAELDRAIRTSALAIEGLAKKELGRGKGGWDTGRLASSIMSRYGPLHAEVGPSANYAIYLHQGTRPHWVPISKIGPWAKRHGLNPYAVQRSIAKKGTKANPFMDRAALVAGETVAKIFADAVAKITSL